MAFPSDLANQYYNITENQWESLIFFFAWSSVNSDDVIPVKK